MAKDPAFLFYPNDFLGGTIGMTLEQIGAYIVLLVLQFNRGHMTFHMIGQVLGQNKEEIWNAIKDKFIQDEKGLYYNIRLEEEKTKRSKYTESRRNNIKGNNQYSKNKINSISKNGHMTSHMENRNRNEDINGNDSLKESVREKIIFSELENHNWFENILRMMEHKINSEKLQKYWLQFQTELTAKDDLYRTKEEYRRHFPSWVKIQVEKNGSESGIMVAKGILNKL